MPETLDETAVILQNWNYRNGKQVDDIALNDLLASLQKVLIESEDDISGGIAEIRAERMRQILSEGYVPEHDKEAHRGKQLAEAAMAYLAEYLNWKGPYPEDIWPFDDEHWKPHPRSKLLRKVGALIAAEIDKNG